MATDTEGPADTAAEQCRPSPPGGPSLRSRRPRSPCASGSGSTVGADAPVLKRGKKRMRGPSPFAGGSAADAPLPPGDGGVSEGGPVRRSDSCGDLRGRWRASVERDGASARRRRPGSRGEGTTQVTTAFGVRCCDACQSRRRRSAMALAATSAAASFAGGTSLSRVALLLLCVAVSSSYNSLHSVVSPADVAAAVEVRWPMMSRPKNSGGIENDPTENMESPSGGGVEVDNEDDVIDLVDDDMIQNPLSGYDSSVEGVSSQRDNLQFDRQKPKIKLQTPQKEDPRHSSSRSEKDDSVIILSAVDGTLAGISRSSGRVLWKQSRDHIGMGNGGDGKKGGSSPIEWNRFLSPLVSTTAKSSEGYLGRSRRQLQAVPSIDGTVYLTGGEGADGDGRGGHELATSAHVRDLVDRSPFVDAHQRFFVGSRRAMVAAVDERTGEILRVIPKWRRAADEGGDRDGEEEEELPPSLEGRDVVWIGRLEHTVTVHDLHRGTVDIEFSVAEILSVDEMIHGEGHVRQHESSLVMREGGDNGAEGEKDTGAREEEEMELLFTDYISEALRHPSSGGRVLMLPAPGESDGEDGEKHGDSPSSQKGGVASSSVGGRGGSPLLVSTPGGNVAFRDDGSDSSSAGWVSFGLLDSPVVYAVEATSGRKIRVNMLDDSSILSSGDPGKDDPPRLLEQRLLQQQIASIEHSAMPNGIIDDACKDDASRECQAVGFSARGSVVGALRNGQVYALPLGERVPRPQLPLGLPQPHSDNVDSGAGQHIRLDDKHKQSCTPSSRLYPGCLVGIGLMMGNLLDVDGTLDVESVFAKSDLDYDLYLGMLEGKSGRGGVRRNSYFEQFAKIMTSWVAPLVALIFVISFEMGRRARERRKAEARKAANADSSGSDSAVAEVAKESRDITTNDQGVIQLSDEVLGYGGHGTIVYRGLLEGRHVAVKRLLAMYHASADREISLLIESDGHPNVVRYFLKEERGDFVYLALELCDLSLNDLIVSLGKLRKSRKENLHLSGNDDLELSTKSLLFQIASGVRHIHSLRIVHRDLKPQNILLAIRGRSKQLALAKSEESEGSDSESDADDATHTTCSDTNNILELFKNQEYVPKISDMGLGKQLAGQSSFGLSTLGTGSVGGAGAGDAGAGAGSVGWSAPEVMAQRWSPESLPCNGNETSESLTEDSPLEAGASHRTSRSVDIFSLGCIFYCAILPGSHPFGEWYEREANIMKNAPKKEDLEFVSPDAGDLILSMLNRNAKARPTADEVCEHPFFWSPSRRLKFLCEFSDRMELWCDASQGNETTNRPHGFKIFALEKGAVDLFGTSWERKVDPELIEASLSRRTYDPSSVRDCLRMIRNKHHHYDELSPKLKGRIGSSTDGLSSYVTRAFPRLVMHCYHFCLENLVPDDSLAVDYKLPTSRLSSPQLNKPTSKVAGSITDHSSFDGKKSCPSLETIPDDVAVDVNLKTANKEEQGEEAKTMTPKLEDVEVTEEELPTILSKSEGNSENSTQKRIDLAQSNCDLSGMVVWAGSNAARDLNCRGWYRSDEEWTQRLDAKLSKRDSNLARCIEDPKFRTRLCNHWDINQGRYCPMKKKGKCIFAHGPVELRVKEGKRHRWGKLVDKNGDTKNKRASGGEDTYGAARSIEKARKEKGQWAVDSPKKQVKGKPKGGKESTKKKKEQS